MGRRGTEAGQKELGQGLGEGEEGGRLVRKEGARLDEGTGRVGRAGQEVRRNLKKKG